MDQVNSVISQELKDQSHAMPDFESEILIVGCVRNCEKSVVKTIGLIKKAFAKFNNIRWLFIESDSDDGTIKELTNLRENIPHFDFNSLGDLKENHPLRTDRIAIARNAYLDEIRAGQKYQSIKYVVIIDLDGVNDLITEEAVLSCWERNDWDVCTANQKGPYYDIWALRHSIWCPNDCWEQYRFLLKYNEIGEEALFGAVYSRMIEIPPNSDWINVDSAFGGFAIYRRSAIMEGRYNGINAEGKETCEHVPFHRAIIQNGGKIFINPRLLNCDYTEHSDRIRLRKPGPTTPSVDITSSYHDVVAAYKIFLNRMPESREVIEKRLRRSTEKLLVDFLVSEEFGSREILDPLFLALGKRAQQRLKTKEDKIKKEQDQTNKSNDSRDTQESDQVKEAPKEIDPGTNNEPQPPTAN